MPGPQQIRRKTPTVRVTVRNDEILFFTLIILAHWHLEVYDTYPSFHLPVWQQGFVVVFVNNCLWRKHYPFPYSTCTLQIPFVVSSYARFILQTCPYISYWPIYPCLSWIRQRSVSFSGHHVMPIDTQTKWAPNQPIFPHLQLIYLELKGSTGSIG